MISYIYALIAVAVLAALAEMISPGGGNGKMIGNIRFITGLCVMLALFSPIKEGIARLTELSEDMGDISWEEEAENRYETYWRDTLMGVTREECEAWIYDALAQNFSISREDCHVTLIFSEQGESLPTVAVVDILLSGRAVLKDPRAVESYIENALSVTCHVSAVWGE